MKMLNTTLQNLLEQTVSSSSLSDAEKEDIERELQSHFFEKQRALQLQGRTEKETDAMITETFGDTDVVGKQFYIVHRRLERIPWIGPLFYYEPLQQAIRIVVWNIMFALLSLIVMMLLGGIDGPLLISLVTVFHPFSVAFITGVYFVYKKFLLKEIVEILSLLYVPLIFIIPFQLFSAGTCHSYAGVCFRFDQLYNGGLLIVIHSICILLGITVGLFVKSLFFEEIA